MILGLSSLALFLSMEHFNSNQGIFFCGAHSFRACVHITCFHCFCSNSVNFYRIKINFNVFWEPLENPKLWSHLCYSDMASFPVAGVFTIRRFTLYLADLAKFIRPLVFVKDFLIFYCNLNTFKQNRCS